MEVGAVILRGRDPFEMMSVLGGYGGRGGLHPLTNPDLLSAWFAGAVKRRDEKTFAELAELSQRHMIEREVDRFDEHLTSDSRPPVDYVQVFDVAEGKKTLASLAVKVAASDLGIDVSEVRWFRQAENGQKPVFSSPPLSGRADRTSKVVWLAVALSPSAVVATVAHEVAHMAGCNELNAQLYAANYEMRTDE